MAEDAAIWQRDVLGKVVVSRPDSMFVFRLEGHAWSIVVNRPFDRSLYGKTGYEWEKSLSRRLQRPVIEYGRSDSCGAIGYVWIVDGEVVEDFYAEAIDFCEDEDDEEIPEVPSSYFTSTRRAVSLDQIDDICDFARDFFVEQDAFEPGIEFIDFFDREPPPIGEHGLVKDPCRRLFLANVPIRGTPVIERVDYLALRSP